MRASQVPGPLRALAGLQVTRWSAASANGRPLPQRSGRRQMEGLCEAFPSLFLVSAGRVVGLQIAECVLHAGKQMREQIGVVVIHRLVMAERLVEEPALTFAP